MSALDPRVVLIEADLHQAYRTVEILAAGSEAYEVEVVRTISEATKSAEARPPDVIVANLHGASARTCGPALKWLCRSTEAPLVVTSTSSRSAEAEAAFEAGAEAFLVQGAEYESELPRVVRVVLERRRAREQLERQAFRDPLTGLHNRASFTASLARALDESRDHGRLALFFADLDGFKAVNDTHGHAVGDLLLQQIGLRLRTRISGQVVARLGGDEFALLAGPIPHLKRSLDIAEAMIQAIEAPVEIEGKTLSVGARVGVALYPLSGHTPQALLQGADQAMYAAKKAGGSIRIHLPDGLPQWGANVPPAHLDLRLVRNG